MARRPSGRVSVTFKLDPEDRDWVDAEAAARGIDRSECLRRFIRANRGAQHYDQTAPPRPTTRRARPDSGLGHPFKPQKDNELRCECGQRQGAHGRA